MALSAITEEQPEHVETLVKHVALTVFLEGKPRHSPQPKQREEPSPTGRPSENSRSETRSHADGILLVRAAEIITVAP